MLKKKPFEHTLLQVHLSFVWRIEKFHKPSQIKQNTLTNHNSNKNI